VTGLGSGRVSKVIRTRSVARFLRRHMLANRHSSCSHTTSLPTAVLLRPHFPAAQPTATTYSERLQMKTTFTVHARSGTPRGSRIRSGLLARSSVRGRSGSRDVCRHAAGDWLEMDKASARKRTTWIAARGSATFTWGNSSPDKLIRTCRKRIHCTQIVPIIRQCRLFCPSRHYKNQ
jgi:hypothetical protein